MIFGNDETIATLLINMSKAKAASKEKDKGVELKDVEESDRPRPTSTRSLLTLKPLLKIDPKDKGKKKIEEEDETESKDDDIPQAMKKFKQIENDEEMARKVQEEWEAEEERNRVAEEQAANEALIKNFDDIKARIEADRILAEKLQEQEREQFTIEERAKFLHDTIAAQIKFLAKQRSKAIRNKPPTKNQVRNQMMTYLKHVRNFKHSELKSKKFEDIQAMYEKIKRSDEDFIAIGSVEDEELIKRMNKKDSSKEEEIKQESKDEIKQESKEEVKEEDKDEESTRKRKHGTRKKMKSRKRRFIQNTSEDDTDKENDELRLYLTIAQDEEKEVDYEILDRKYPIIDWKTEYLGTKPQFDESKRLEEINVNVVTRSNGQKRYFSTLISVLSVLDREDLDAVYKLVMDIYQDKIPEGFDKVLWGDLIVMFNPDEQDEFWNSQHEWKVVSWKLHNSSGVHTLMTDEGLVVHMLVEKKYPLKMEIVVQMLKLKLEYEEDSTMALELIRFIKKSWLVQDQTVLGKDYSNLLIADSLLKTIWFINAPCYDNEALASPNTNDEELSIPEQTATGKGTSNPLMAGSRKSAFVCIAVDTSRETQSRSNAQSLVNILRCFELASRLKVNIGMSRIFGIGVPNEDVQSVASSLGCVHGVLPFIYLGHPVGKKMRLCGSWDEIVNRVRSRLSAWKAKSLSIGGRLTLIKSVLSSLPIYFLSLFKAPVKVINLLESFRCRFFWGFKDSQRGISWVKWKSMLLDPDKGGLGMGSIHAKNLGLLGKWKWRFLTEHDALWRLVISEFYGEDGGFYTPSNSSIFGGVWGDIIKASTSIESIVPAYKNSFSIKISNGSNVSFWKDIWCKDRVRLMDVFLILFALDSSQDCSVSDRWNLVDGLWTGNWNWRFQPRGRSLGDLDSLISLLGNMSLSPDGVDTWQWNFDSSGKLPTRSNLESRGVPIASVMCPFCDNATENEVRCLLYCPRVVKVWRKVWSWWNLGLSNVFPHFFIRDIALGSVSDMGCNRLNKILHGVFQCSLWAIWTWRNKLVNANLEDVISIREEDIFPSIQRLSKAWIAARFSKGTAD
ncbi:hypothetical protein Tco_0381604 [Tanacetum coccineum]